MRLVASSYQSSRARTPISRGMPMKYQKPATERIQLVAQMATKLSPRQ